VTRPVPWAELAGTLVAMLAALAIARTLGVLGIPIWLCWALFGVIFLARVTHGWMTTQRPLPSTAVPMAMRLPLDAVTLGTLWGVWLR
jgi:uncharacterized membrane protein YecN with MAPEG domain